MTLVLIIGLGLLAIAVALIARAVISPPRTQRIVCSRSVPTASPARSSTPVVRAVAVGVAALDDLANNLGEFMAKRIGPAREAELQTAS